MNGLVVEDHMGESEVAEYLYPGVTCSGDCRSARFAPSGFSLQLVRARLEDGASLRWSSTGWGEQVVYVIGGEMLVDGHTCPAGGSIIVEDAIGTVLQTVGKTEILHFGIQRPKPGEADDAGDARSPKVAIFGPRGMYATVTDERETRFFADSQGDLATTFFLTGRSGRYRSLPHSHSQDEILYVVNGSIFFGKREIPTGSAVAVAADRKYGFVSADDGFGMLNYRRGASYFSGPGDVEPFLEGGAATGMELVGDRIL